jgi:NAD+ synthase
MTNLAIDCALTARVLEDFLRLELGKFGFTQGVVGLSGGVDSATSAFLAAGALGPENVTAILMPYSSSSPQSEADALAVVEQLGIHHLLVDITPQIDAYFERFPDASRMRRANKMARERMTILYDQSAAIGALVIGTSNKTEALLGYTTLWGDMACAVNPLGDLYKTQLRQLARHLGVPAAILDKAPSADLWPGQTDEGELGFTYENVDQVLYRLVDLRMQPEEILAEGFPEELLGRVQEMVRQSQYKRRLPPVAKLSRRSVDRDFRYPRDWEA